MKQALKEPAEITFDQCGKKYDSEILVVYLGPLKTKHLVLPYKNDTYQMSPE